MPFRLAATLTVLLLASVRGPTQDVLLESLDRQPQPVYAADGLMATEKPREVIDQAFFHVDTGAIEASLGQSQRNFPFPAADIECAAF